MADPGAAVGGDRRLDPVCRSARRRVRRHPRTGLAKHCRAGDLVRTLDRLARLLGAAWRVFRHRGEICQAPPQPFAGLWVAGSAAYLWLAIALAGLANDVFK